MEGLALQSVGFARDGETTVEGLIAVKNPPATLSPDEAAVVRNAASFAEIDYVFFRRFGDGRSSQPAAFVIDNSSERLSADELARVHNELWLHGVAPLVYVAWPTRIDILSCARGPDFWKKNERVYSPAEQIEVASQVEAALKQCRRFSAERLADGTFWDDPQNRKLANQKASAHSSLIQAIVEVDDELEGSENPVLRRLLLLTVLIKYLEDRRVFPTSGWFGRFHKGARSFFDVLKSDEPESVLRLLSTLEDRFNGDVFELPFETGRTLNKSTLRKFAKLVEARTLKQQRYLWEQYSFEHLPVEVISNLYQRFVHGDTAVYTPPFLAALLLDFAMPYERLTGNERVLDPACGSGVFLVGAFRRLVNVWRSQHGWRRPTVKTLKRILNHSVFGIELDPGALDLTAFSLALAVCDALKPNVIWNELQFDPLRGTNLLEGDFFDWVIASMENKSKGIGVFDVVIGNPPFESQLTESGDRVDDLLRTERPRVPDKQTAYLFLEQAIGTLTNGGRVCLIQPSGLLYNRQVDAFRRRILEVATPEAVLDFTSIRNLYDGADPKTVAVLARTGASDLQGTIRHLTFRRTFFTHERLGFELDHYDCHTVHADEMQEDRYVWRANLLGGGRLSQVGSYVRNLPTIKKFVDANKWLLCEGYIVGGDANQVYAAEYLTGNPGIPTEALTSDGIDEEQIDTIHDLRFTRARTEELFTPPLVLIREHESLPVAYWDKSRLGFKDKIVGIHAPAHQATQLREFFETIRSRIDVYRFAVAINGSQALIGKATAILQGDIEALPYPTEGGDLSLSFWESAIAEDATEYMTSYVRLGHKSELLKRAADSKVVAQYSAMLCRMLESVYTNICAADPLFLNGIICQPIYFGDEPLVEWLGPDCEEHLEELLYDDVLESLRTIRVVRLYHENVVFIFKPDRLRYWIRSTAVRDADDTLIELKTQGY